MKVKANGITVHCRVDGPDECALPGVFSNSLATDAGHVGPAGRGVAASCCTACCATTSAATAATDAPAGRYSLRHPARRCPRPCSMRSQVKPAPTSAGLSMGGATALGLAERHPERFDRIIVCDLPCQSTPQSSQQWEERIVIAQKQGIDALVELTVSRWVPPEIVAKIRRMSTKSAP